MPIFVYQQLDYAISVWPEIYNWVEIKMKSFSKMCSHHIYSILLQQFVYLPKRKKYKLDSFLNLHHGYSHDQPLTLNLFLFKLFLNLQIIGFLMMPKCRERDHSFHLGKLFIYLFIFLARI